MKSTEFLIIKKKIVTVDLFRIRPEGTKTKQLLFENKLQNLDQKCNEVQNQATDGSHKN